MVFRLRSVWWAAVNTAPASAKSPPWRLEWYLLITLTYRNVKWKKRGPHCRGTLGLSAVGSLQFSKLGCKREDSEAAGYLTAPDHLLLLMLGNKMSHVYGGRPEQCLKISLLNVSFFAFFFLQDIGIAWRSTRAWSHEIHMMGRSTELCSLCIRISSHWPNK